jgi:Lrp/AsnC family leucine-responsive transcriptional regulator
MAEYIRENDDFAYGPMSSELDEVSLRILGELRGEPRLTMAELGRRIGMSSPGVTERVRRLEDAGVIAGYRLDVNPAAVGLPVSAYVRVRPNTGSLPRIAELARQIPEVVECYRVTGEDCFIMKVHIPEVGQLDRLLDQFLQYGSTTTSIIQSTTVALRPPPVPGVQVIRSID